jgi:hypothetical protein
MGLEDELDFKLEIRPLSRFVLLYLTIAVALENSYSYVAPFASLVFRFLSRSALCPTTLEPVSLEPWLQD